MYELAMTHTDIVTCQASIQFFTVMFAGLLNLGRRAVHVSRGD